MLYKFAVNYVRLKLLEVVLNRFLGSKWMNKKNPKTVYIITSMLEFITSYYLSNQSKVKK